MEYWKQNIQKSVSKMRANIDTKVMRNMKNRLWDHMMDMHVTNDQEQFIALLYYLNANEGQQDWEDVDNMIGEDYLVLTDEEADDMVRDYIEESAGMFTPSFLSGFTGIDEEVFKVLQEKGDMAAYDAIRSMIRDFDAFVEAAVSADGRGHFLATYDHNEHEVIVNDTPYYIYRVN